MAPIASVPCFAAKDKSGKLELWQYEPKPLGDGDVGKSVNTCCLSVVCLQTTLLLTHYRAAFDLAGGACRDPCHA